MIIEINNIEVADIALLKKCAEKVLMFGKRANKAIITCYPASTSSEWLEYSIQLYLETGFGLPDFAMYVAALRRTNDSPVEFHT